METLEHPVAQPQDPEVTSESAASSAKAVLRSVGRKSAGEKEPIERLIEQSEDFFGVAPHVAAGALHAVAGEGVTELTREQGKRAIETWLAEETD